MTAPQYQARRANLDDLPGLRALWLVEQLPGMNLERRVADFQIALNAQGEVIGALALQVDGLHGRLHSEVFKDFGLADTLRPMLWERIHTVARNRGLVRLWTLETTQFWRGLDFAAASPELMEKFPAALGDPSAPWTTLKLKDELLSNLSPEQEFALFKDAIKAESDKALRQAKILKGIATVVAFVLFGLVVMGGIYLIKYKDYSERHGGPPQLPPAKK